MAHTLDVQFFHTTSPDLLYLNIVTALVLLAACLLV